MPAPAAGVLPDPACGAAFWAAGFAWVDVEFLLLIVLAGLTGLGVGLAATPVLAGAAGEVETGFAGFAGVGLLLVGVLGVRLPLLVAFGAGALVDTADFLLATLLPATLGFFAGATGLEAFLRVGFAEVLLAGFDLLSGLREGAAGLDLATGLDLTAGFDAFLGAALTTLTALAADLPVGAFFAVFVLAIVGTLLSR
jgi:hypothetical protein